MQRERDIMKALSVHQPFASLIANGEKTIETRKWPTSYRGDLLIVSTQRVYQPNPDLPLGKALCVVMLYDCVPSTFDHAEAACCRIYDGAWSWLLEDIRPIEPFPVRGRQRIYEVELPEGVTCGSL